MPSSPRLGRKTVPLHLKALSIVLLASIALATIPIPFISVISPAQAAPSPNIVISQVYGGGGNSGAIYKNDFIELYNRGTTSIDVTGWSVQYASATGISWQVTTLSGVMIPGGYYLIQEAAGSGGTTDLPAPGSTGNINMSGTVGKVALVNNSTSLNVSCPTVGVVDFVGFGTTANCFEGTGPTPAPSNTTAVLRKLNGTQDNDSNSGDFVTGTPTPRSTLPPKGTGASNPGSVAVGDQTLLTVTVTSGTTPASTGIAVKANLTSIGGSATQQFYNDGSHGDVTAGDNIFSFNATIGTGTAGGSKSLTAIITDAQGRTGSGIIPVTILVATSPTGTGSANPGTVQAGSRTLLTVTVTPGANPASTGLSVTADLTSIGGSASQQFFDDGSHGDAVSGDKIFSFEATVAAGIGAGGKTIPATIIDGQSRNGNVSISLTVAVGPTSPSGIGSATPASLPAGSNSLLKVAVTPGDNPPSTGLTVTANLSSIGGSNNQQFYDDGSHGDITALDNTFSFNATVAAGTAPGEKTLPVAISDSYPRTTNITIGLTVSYPPPSPGDVVISQIYGGGGNSGATYRRDFIELFNRSSNPVDLAGLSVQYTSAVGPTASQPTWFTTPLSGIIMPGHYFLIEEAAGNAGTVDLPSPDVSNGGIAMGASNGKVALVVGTTPMTTSCPINNVIDFIGYGSANCAEGDDQTGGDNAGPALSNTTAALRAENGCVDTNSNASDFTAGAPTPRNSLSAVNNCDSNTTPPTTTINSIVVISQVYGGGGNEGAAFTNDFVELYNRGTEPINLTGWSLQYASATGNGWDSNKQPLGGSIAPGEYYLVKLGSGNTVSQSLPPANVTGEINLSASSGKIALVKTFDGLQGNCPLSDPNLADLVGYGSTANCGEGNKKAPTPGSANAIFRKNGGITDTDNNQGDFTTGTPNPRRTAPIVELGPAVLGTDPRSNSTTAPRDASIAVNFTEEVNVESGWFSINCTTTGAHTDVMVTGGYKNYLLTPNVSFVNGEQCTVTIYAALVNDRDLDDSGPNTNTLLADYTLSFSTSTGTTPPYGPDVHLLMGNPSNATADVGNPNNYLMLKPELAISYNKEKGTPNWVSWHLSDEWTGSLSRVDSFRPDPAVPSSWYRVLHTDYAGSGFDRGHMVPNADRDKETSIPINQATFLMTNMLPQAPDNNQGPWAAYENYLRTLLPANEVYIIAGGVGVGGNSGSGVVNTIANGKVTVPAQTWKVALIMPKESGDDVQRVTAATRTIAILMPNVQGIRNTPWENYITTVDNVEALTGYDFFSNLPDAVENAIEAGTNGSNPPGTEGQLVSTPEDTAKVITLSAVSPNNDPLTYTIVTQPQHGTLSGTGPDVTYTPFTDYTGPDSFTFRASTGSLNSNISTVAISVTEFNEAPVANADAKSALEDQPLSFQASDLSANDSVGEDNEAGQALSVTTITATGDTHGGVILSAGQIIYTPDVNYNGPASFEYQVCDNGTSNGIADSKCSTGTVNVTVEAVNDNPVATDDSVTTDEDTPVTIEVAGNDTDVDGDTVTLSSVGSPVNGTVTIKSGKAVFSPTGDYNGTGSFTYTVIDSHGGTASGSVIVTINSINDKPVLSGVPENASINELAPYTFTASASDVDGQTLSFLLVNAPAGATIDSNGLFLWIPTEGQGGTGSTFVFKVTVSDGLITVENEMSISVNEVNQAPVLDHIDDQTVSLGSNLTFTATGSDADLPTQGLSYSLTGTVPAGAIIDPSTGVFNWTPTAAQVGVIYTFNVRVTDNGTPNRYAEQAINVAVAYTWSGLLAPINADGSSVFKLGRTIPVKFKLTGASAGIGSAVAKVYLTKISDGVAGSEAEAEATGGANTGNTFRYDAAADQYIFNLSTSGLTAGTYQLRVDLGDGVIRVVNFGLRN